MPDRTNSTGACPSWCNPNLHITTHRRQLDAISDGTTFADILLREHSGLRRLRVAFGEQQVSERGFDLTVEEAELLIASLPEFRDALTAGVRLLRQSE
jgi:hypothetical protein